MTPRVPRTGAALAFLLAGAWVMVGRAEPVAPPPSFSEVVAAAFAGWDTDHDGTLSVAELDALVANPEVKGRTAAAAATLKRASRDPKPPTFTLPAIRELAAAPPRADAPDYNRMFKQGCDRLTAATARELFVGPSPRLDTIHQGKLGNCFSLAPLGAWVHRDPGSVAGLIARQPDGRYRVQFGTKAVVVAPPTDTELAMSSSNENAGLWVNLYEKAAGTLLNEARPADKRVGSPLDALAKGGSAGTMLGHLTGHDIGRISFRFSKDAKLSPAGRAAQLAELRRQLVAATQEKRLMTCGTIEVTTPGLTPKHAYAVLAYDEATDQVTLWNPHGQAFTPKGPAGLANGYATKDGVFRLPVEEWVGQFTGFAYEKTAVTAAAK
jgi:hypothetical protein